VLHEPIGWTPAAGPTCGLFHQLPWALADFLAGSARYFRPGFRLLVPVPDDAASRAAVAAALGAPAAAEAVVPRDAATPLRLFVYRAFV